MTNFEKLDEVNELTYAYKIKGVLNYSLEQIPSGDLQRLAFARQIALQRKKPEMRNTFALNASADTLILGSADRFSMPPPNIWAARIATLLPVIVLCLGLMGIYQYEQQRHINDLADLETAVLSDDLPLNAYLDRGFNAYLKAQGE